MLRNETLLGGLGLALVVSGAACFLLSKCFFLARWRAGWLMMAANAVYELCSQRLRWLRPSVDTVLLVSCTAVAVCALGPSAGVVVAAVMGLAWGWSLNIDIRWRSGELARQYARTRGRVPLPIPKLIVQVRGPVLRRGSRVYSLGDWPVGWEQEFKVLVLNPSLVRPQLPLKITIEKKGTALEVIKLVNDTVSCPEPGEFVEQAFCLRAQHPGSSAGVEVRVEHGDFAFQRRLEVNSIIEAGQVAIAGALIRRWKHGAHAAFCWRGDHDLYDPCTFQSADGLRIALG